ncbi:MAG: carbohydrate-binding family 9-like protein, partial [Lachnospiraceae bacterium]
MKYLIKTIDDKSLLNTCHQFIIQYPLWNTTILPNTYGYLGFVPNDGFYLHMTCEESNPLRTYTEMNAPVFKDSAMEFFLQLSTDHVLSPIYLNFEMNANGALLGMYGDKREKRNLFSYKEIK